MPTEPRTGFVSEPLLDLLGSAGLSAAEIDDETRRLGERGLPTLLRPGHPYLELIGQRRGLKIVGIARRYRRLLVEVEELVGDEVVWTYREHSRTETEFAFPLGTGDIPDTALYAYAGQRLGRLVEAPVPFSATMIQLIHRRHRGWLHVAVEPRWHAF